MMLERRKEDEARFHDTLRLESSGQRWSRDLERTIKADPRWANMKYYSVERRSRQAVLDWFAANCPGKRVLDYCCGNGDDSFIIANDGAAQVVGIDISEVSVANCRKRAGVEGCDGRATFHVMDAEALTFEDNYFDIATEYGALHHLELELAYRELARVLKPEGRAICVEALGHNPTIRAYRRWTPQLRTAWEVEHILRRRDIELAKRFFEHIEYLGFFHLVSLLAVPFRTGRFFEPILRSCEAIDRGLLRLPIVRWHAWQVVFVLSRPKKRR